MDLEYRSERRDNPATERIWSKTLQPKERVLFPQSLENLRTRWRESISERRMTPDELARLSGLPRKNVIRAIKGDYATIGEADAISESLGFSLKRYPAELRRGR